MEDSKLFLRSYAEVLRLFDNGRITHRQWRRYFTAWLWSDFRHGGTAGICHDRYWAKRGRSAYLKRLNRMRRVLGLPLFVVNNSR